MSTFLFFIIHGGVACEKEIFIQFAFQIFLRVCYSDESVSDRRSCLSSCCAGCSCVLSALMIGLSVSSCPCHALILTISQTFD